MSETEALCRYCGLRPPVVGDVYCCTGCQVLDSLRSKEPHPEHISKSDQDPFLVENFGCPLPSLTSFEMHVEPLVCEACLQSLVKLPQHFPSLQDVEWHRKDGVLKFYFSKGMEQPDRLFGFMEKMQLAPRWKKPGEESEAGKVRKAQIMRLGVAGAIAGNMMLFAIPIYGGLAGDMQRIFEWIQFFLFLPTFFWCAQPFYRTAWVSTRMGALSVDAPLVVAFVLGSAFSVWSLLTGGHEIYFDSLAGFLFFILMSRFLLESSLAKHLESPHFERFLPRPYFLVENEPRQGSRLWNQLQVNDEIYLQAGDRLPVDGVLLSEAAEFETSWMTGESEPSLRLLNSEVQAGVSLISPFARVRVTKIASETLFAQIIEKLKNPPEKLSISSESKIGTALVLICFIATLVLFLFGKSLGFDEVLRRSVALLIVACPCAISFAAPLARAQASQLAGQLGAWIRSPEIWTRILTAKKIAFDKTGTLTGGILCLIEHSPMVDEQFKRIILSLENVSKHPVAEALRRDWGPLPLYEVHDPLENPGVGVQGTIRNVRYEFKRTGSLSENLHVELFADGRRVLELEFYDEIRPGVEDLVRKLSDQYEVFIISGDQNSRVQRLAKSLGLPLQKVFGELKPQDKLTKIIEIQPDIYFGDGTNDLLALQRAPVSVAVGAATFEAQAASDVLLLSGNLGLLDSILEIAQETRKVVLRNFSVALLYNLAAGTSALLGWINPLLAAVLMPIASFALMGSTLLGTKKLRLLRGQTK